MTIDPRPFWLMLGFLLVAAGLLAACAAPGGGNSKICVDMSFEPAGGVHAEAIEGGGQICWNFAPGPNGVPEIVPQNVVASLDRMREQTVVVLPHSGGTGSGAIISATRILTSKHVVAFGDDVDVEFMDGTRAAGRVVWRHEQLDLAVVAVPFASFAMAELRCDPLPVGEPVTVVGNPLGSKWTVTRGYVAGFHHDGVHTLLDAALNPGNSGGPIFDSDGRVAGIAMAYMSFGLGVQSGLGVMVGAHEFCESTYFTRS